MKKKFSIIAMLMMCLAVQGYAQGRHENQRGQRTEQRREYRNSERRREYTRSRVNGNNHRRERIVPARNPQRTQEGYRQQSQTPRRNNYGNRGYQPHRNNYGNRGYQPRYVPPSRNHSAPYRYRPTPPPPRYHHHHGYHHHHHRCYFNDWYWYSWGGYRNRFICHRHYHNRFFDSMLGYYLWGKLNAPTRLDIGNLTITRYNNLLKLQVGTQCSYMDLYTSQTVQYQMDKTVVNISTGNGYATIRFYDDYGNEAVYNL